jgi:hypothetical protein
MALPPVRQLKPRAGTVSVVTVAGTAHWDNSTAVLIEDGSTATQDLATGTGGDKLNVLFPAVSEVIHPQWQVTGFEIRVRGACTGNTNPDMAPPSLGLRLLPGEGNRYASQQRIAPLQYLAAPTAWIVLGGPGDVWGVPDVHEIAKDAATVGLLVEVDPKPWTQRPALLQLDAVELILHLQAVPFPVDPDAPPVSDPAIARVQHERFAAYGVEPLLLDPGAIAGNHLEGQLWLGAPNGAPVPLITMRGGYTDARRYHPGQLVYLGNVIYRCNVEKAAGAPFLGASWTQIS